MNARKPRRSECREICHYSAPAEKQYDAIVYAAASIFLRTIYLLLPCASLFAAIWVRRRSLRRQILGAWVSGILVASVVLAAYAFVISGLVETQQVALTLYLGVSLMLFLKLIDFALRAAIMAAVRRMKQSALVTMGAMAVRAVIFSCIALPWVMSALTVYRPRVTHIGHDLPPTDAVAVWLSSRDGTRLAGWWVPPLTASNTTALLCPGLGGSKSDFRAIIRALHEQNIGVLAIDLRAHNQSGGQISTFGAHESLDVLGAVDWLKSLHARQAERVIGVGETIGAAALLSAAADDDRINAVAAITVFDTLQNEVTSIADSRLIPPVNWLVRGLGLTIASLHAGVDLTTVRPSDRIGMLWPRPVLVVHATQDDVVPFALGRHVRDSASIPRDQLWVEGVTHNGFLDNAEVIRRVTDFVRWATPMPVI